MAGSHNSIRYVRRPSLRVHFYRLTIPVPSEYRLSSAARIPLQRSSKYPLPVFANGCAARHSEHTFSSEWRYILRGTNGLKSTLSWRLKGMILKILTCTESLLTSTPTFKNLNFNPECDRCSGQMSLEAGRGDWELVDRSNLSPPSSEIAWFVASAVRKCVPTAKEAEGRRRSYPC